MAQFSPATEVDFVVIGSGAGGGTAVKVLTDLNIRVALLEAGPMLNPVKDFKEHRYDHLTDFCSMADTRFRAARLPPGLAMVVPAA